MDIISHALYANLIFKEVPLEQRGLICFFSILPDLISFFSITGKGFLRKVAHYTNPPKEIFPKIVFRLYNITHSLVIWIFVFFILKIIGLDYWALVYMGWGSHIILDIFTHSNTFFPTPILWPLSKFHFSGIRWSNKWFMLFNYSLLLFLYWYFY